MRTAFCRAKNCSRSPKKPRSRRKERRIQMFSKMGLRAKLYFGFGTVLAIIMALGVFVYVKLGSVANLEKLITGDCLPGMAKMAEIETLSRARYELVPEHLL